MRYELCHVFCIYSSIVTVLRQRSCVRLAHTHTHTHTHADTHADTQPGIHGDQNLHDLLCESHTHTHTHTHTHLMLCETDEKSRARKALHIDVSLYVHSSED